MLQIQKKSATVQAAFIYTQILSLTRGTEITFLWDDL